MAGTEGTTPEAEKPEVKENKSQATPTKEVSKYFLPETGQVVEATSAEEAAKKAKATKGNEG
jgi:hypothetical protein